MNFQFIKVNMKKKTRKGKIINLSDHDKLINLISIHNEKDVNYLLQSVDQVFFEVFNIKKKICLGNLKIQKMNGTIH